MGLLSFIIYITLIFIFKKNEGKILYYFDICLLCISLAASETIQRRATVSKNEIELRNCSKIVMRNEEAHFV